jgi:DNA-binding protein HU-beta
MNKADLVTRMSEKSDLSKKDTEKVLDAFVECVGEILAEGDRISLIGFGSFEVKERAERKGRNPQTNKEIVIPAGKAPVFKVGKSLKDAVNK